MLPTTQSFCPDCLAAKFQPLIPRNKFCLEPALLRTIQCSWNVTPDVMRLPFISSLVSCWGMSSISINTVKMRDNVLKKLGTVLPGTAWQASFSKVQGAQWGRHPVPACPVAQMRHIDHFDSKTKTLGGNLLYSTEYSHNYLGVEPHTTKVQS